jgi:ADP-dependent NAD(P)H-hydrate dehydratase / NAD(P)H-hydrate epimerase
MKLFNVSQISAIDKYTIANEPIESIDLMERASKAICNKIIEIFSKDKKIVVVAGHGNNGGDGLAVARMLHENGYTVRIILVDLSNKLSIDCQKNFDRIISFNEVKYIVLKNISELKFEKNEVIIDALYGSGLSRQLEGLSLDIVKKINVAGNKILSIDLPSGLFGEDNLLNNPIGIVNADYTLTLQFPKISFFFAENEKYTGKWFVLPIGLHSEIIKSESSTYHFIEINEIRSIIKIRKTFSHKGSYGHALLISGSYGKIGAAVLASRACMRTGAGLLTTHIPKCGNEIIQTAIPEAMVSADTCNNFISELPEIQNYAAIGIGPGIGLHALTAELVYKLLTISKMQMVLDADALNILSENKNWFDLLPENTILTPHPKEFDRLVGVSENTFIRHLKAKDFAKKYQVIIVLKGAYTQVICPDGTCYINSTGNPGMATGGSGDVLLGIILGLLSQGYSSIEAAILGVYLHGLAGDLAEINYSQESIIAGDIIENIGNAYKKIHSDL